MIDFSVTSSLLHGLQLAGSGQSQRVDVRQIGNIVSIKFIWLDNSPWTIESSGMGVRAVVKQENDLAAQATALRVEGLFTYERSWQFSEHYGGITWTERGWWEGLRRLWSLNHGQTQIASGEFHNGRFAVRATEDYPRLVPVFAAIALSCLGGSGVIGA